MNTTPETQIVPVACLKDNYAYLIHDPQTDFTAVIDPSEAPPIERALAAKGWTLGAILNTHHHWDHIGGNAELKSKFACPVFAASTDRERIPTADRDLVPNTTARIGPFEVAILSIPGHTLHHIALYVPRLKSVFTGDTLFVLGCGRLFEGTPAQMTDSLMRLAALPEETAVYCGHEYFENNLSFARSRDPQDAGLLALEAEWSGKTEKRSVPSSIVFEKNNNPFLRVLDSGYRGRHRLPTETVEAFAVVRQAKDAF